MARYHFPFSRKVGEHFVDNVGDSSTGNLDICFFQLYVRVGCLRSLSDPLDEDTDIRVEATLLSTTDAKADNTELQVFVNIPPVRTDQGTT